MLIDMKASKTATASLFSGIRRVAKNFEKIQNFQPIDRVVIYGGKQLYDLNAGTLLPWNRMNDYAPLNTGNLVG